jgi:hypothetical protein
MVSSTPQLDRAAHELYSWTVKTKIVKLTVSHFVCLYALRGPHKPIVLR